jgi:site-specific DNA-methyltransferase (adenine-specific)
MLDFGYYNMDCLKGMKQFPDKFFDLAIVDPPTGQSEHGGKDRRGKSKHIKKGWDRERMKADYIEELFRVSKEQIFWQAIFYQEYLYSSRGWIIWDKKLYNSDYADCELAWTSFTRGAKILQHSKNGGDIRTFVDIIQPCQKPIYLYRWCLRNYARDGWKIIDTHVGSASSLIACETEGFEYVGFELDEDYFQNSTKRLEQWRKSRTIDLLLE